MPDSTLIEEIEDYLQIHIEYLHDDEMNRFYASEEKALLEKLRYKQPFEEQLKAVRTYLKLRNEEEATELAGRIDEYLNVLS